MQYFVGAAILAATAVGAIQEPESNCCILYDNSNFGGATKTICLDTESYPDGRWFNMKDIGFDNTLNGFICGRSVFYNFCRAAASNPTKGPVNCEGDEGHSGAGYNANPEIH